MKITLAYAENSLLHFQDVLIPFHVPDSTTLLAEVSHILPRRERPLLAGKYKPCIKGSNRKFQVNFTKNESGKFVNFTKNESGKFVAPWHEVVASLLHLWLSLITFMVVQFITFMGKFCYIYGWYYIYGFYYIYGWYSCRGDPVLTSILSRGD